MACGKQDELEKITALARDKIAKDLDIIDENVFAFCWIVDYPMFEKDESTNKIKFSHNPFSMPQGDLSEKDFENPLDILAYQYDIVCNGIELSSGAIRNHKPELMYKLFSIAGYDKNQVDEKFSGMINALSYGAPPHGGIAPGIDRIVMLLANEKNIREITMFPLNQNAQDLMMNAPSEISNDQLKELNLTFHETVESMVKVCDVVTINCPLHPETENLFDDAMISKMKKGAYIVNTARGKICNRDAIAKALKRGQLSGYAGDVWFPQPAPNDHVWRSMPHHGMTPHTSGTSLTAQSRYADGVREILECFFEGKEIRNQYLIVKDGQLAGMGAHSYSKGSATGGSEEAAKYKKK